MSIDMKTLAEQLATTKVLIVDDETYMRKVVATLLESIGVQTIYEAEDGPTGLDLIRRKNPNVVILDWQMPGLDGPGFMRIVRSPNSFSYPDVPIIMLTGHGERSRVVEALKVGVNEFLVKPVSSKSLHDRLAEVITKPRPMIWNGEYYGPAPRKLSSVAKEADQSYSNIYLVN